MEPEVGLEPTTPALRKQCSATELLRHEVTDCNSPEARQHSGERSEPEIGRRRRPSTGHPQNASEGIMAPSYYNPARRAAPIAPAEGPKDAFRISIFLRLGLTISS